MQPISLSKIFAWRIASKYNKDVVFLCTGERGAGKSVSTLYIAWKTAQEISKIRGGKWQDYFSLDNMAVINPSELIEKMQNLKPYNIYLLDDAGAGWSARSFMSKQNQFLSHILQTCRTQNAGIFITTPDLFLIDKIPRNLASFIGEVSESHHNKGYNLLKVFRTERLQRAGKTLYSHLQFHTPAGKSKILRWVARLPPTELLDEYNKIREKKAIDLMQSEMEGTNRGSPNKVAEKWEMMIETYGEKISNLRRNGKNAQEISIEVGLSEYSIRKICNLMKAPFSR